MMRNYTETCADIYKNMNRKIEKDKRTWNYYETQGLIPRNTNYHLKHNDNITLKNLVKAANGLGLDISEVL